MCKKEPKGSHRKMFYLRETAQVIASDKQFARANNLKVRFLKNRIDQLQKIMIICTTEHQRNAVVGRIGNPAREVIVKNYFSSAYHKMPKPCRSCLEKNGVLVFPRGDIVQLVFPNPESHAKFEGGCLR